jgi:hypothetical protein
MVIVRVGASRVTRPYEAGGKWWPGFILSWPLTTSRKGRGIGFQFCNLLGVFSLLPTASRLRAGMMSSRLNHREHVIPALTDHLEDKGGVIGPRMVRSRPGPLNPLQWISPNFLVALRPSHIETLLSTSALDQCRLPDRS